MHGKLRCTLRHQYGMCRVEFKTLYELFAAQLNEERELKQPRLRKSLLLYLSS